MMIRKSDEESGGQRDDDGETYIKSRGIGTVSKSSSSKASRAACP